MTPKAEKKRIDQILVERGHAPSRERAQALLMAGHVLVNDTPVTKPGEKFAESIEIRLREKDHPYVSRGALKLKKALETFGIRVEGRFALDVGASTGGFTQVLLEFGADHVVAVDVGQNQMDWKIRNDPRVTCIEKLNARELRLDLFRQKIDIATVDVSFISLKKILPPLFEVMQDGGDVVTLIKPQFEVGREQVGKGGIVTDPEARESAVASITEFTKGLGWERIALIESPITGTDGNVEFLAHWRPRSSETG